MMKRIGLVVALSVCLPASATGVLTVHPENPRYFTDGSGRVVYLAGHQMFVDLQEAGVNVSILSRFGSTDRL